MKPTDLIMLIILVIQILNLGMMVRKSTTLETYNYHSLIAIVCPVIIVTMNAVVK